MLNLELRTPFIALSEQEAWAKGARSMKPGLNISFHMVIKKTPKQTKILTFFQKLHMTQRRQDSQRSSSQRSTRMPKSHIQSSKYLFGPCYMV